MDKFEKKEIAKDVVAFLLAKDYGRQDIDLILRKAIDVNEDDWIWEEENESINFNASV